jgi:transmembrane sensor
MSEARANGQTTPNSEVEACAAAWLRRQQYFDWSQAEQTKLDMWLAESNNHAAAYWRIKAAWSRTERLAAIRAPRSDAMEHARSRPLLTRGIAVFSFALVFGLAATLFPTSSQKTFSTTVGGRQVVMLPDGSKIDLNTDTVVRANLSSDRPIVEVEKGEAFFSIKHNAANPFVVVAAGHRIVDIGTTFTVRASADKLEVALVSGRARLEAAHDSMQQRSKILAPGDVAIATADSLRISRKSSNELKDELAWRGGILVFHNTRLADAADQFNRYNDAKLVVPDAHAAALTINGKFRTDGVEQFARATRDVFGLQLEHRGRDLVIGR